MIKQLLNLVSQNIVTFQWRADQLIDLLALTTTPTVSFISITMRSYSAAKHDKSDKSRYFAQPRPIIVHYLRRQRFSWMI